MKAPVPVALLLSSVFLYLVLVETVRGQDTLAFGTVDYDEETNTVYGYAYTEPDYAAELYYGTAYVGAKLRDANDYQLAAGSQQVYGRAEIFLQATGNGNPPFKIQSGHYVFLSYYVYDYWDPYTYQYTSGYLDYYYYTYFSEGPGGPITDVPLYFLFAGRSPESVIPSINRFLGTLLSTIFTLPRVRTIRQQIIDESPQGDEVIECGQFKVITKYETGCPFGPGQETTHTLIGHIEEDAILLSETINEVGNDGEKCTYEATRLYRMKNRLDQAIGTGFTTYKAKVSWDGKTALKDGPGISTRATIAGVGPCP